MQAVIELEDAIVSRTTPTLTLPRSTRGGDKRSTRGGDKRSSRGRDKKALYDRPATIGRRVGMNLHANIIARILYALWPKGN
jgi:hypothetical protein